MDIYLNIVHNIHIFMNYKNVLRAKDNTLYMAYYFPQYHITPENIIKKNYYTDWDFIKNNIHKSITPHEYYNLNNENIINKQDNLANLHNIGVFIFYTYWTNNCLNLNLPIDIFCNKKRKTKFLLFWDNKKNSLLGEQLYNKPEQHAYQLIRYFINDNYLTDINGLKPFIIYSSADLDINYLNRFIKFLKIHNINLKLGFSYDIIVNNLNIPVWGNIACEFGPHLCKHNERINKLYDLNKNIYNINCKEYWQGVTVSWDSRPRILSGRSHQKNNDNTKSNGQINIHKFKLLLENTKKNFHKNNKDKIITIFAWNEWAEGASLEYSIEYSNKFLKILQD